MKEQSKELLDTNVVEHDEDHGAWWNDQVDDDYLDWELENGDSPSNENEDFGADL